MIWIGVAPTPFLDRMEPSVEAVIERVTGRNPVADVARGNAPAVLGVAAGER
jgi:hypothetical protein